MRKNFKIKTLIIIFVLLAGIVTVYAEMPANEIIAKSQAVFYYQAEDLKASVSMRLINQDGKERQRKLIMIRKNLKNNEQKYFMYFEEPQDVRGMAFMVHKLPDKDDLRWLFIPALKMVRRIAASDRRSSFVGSDFTYEDISGRDLNSDTHKLIKREIIDGVNCFVIESIPKEKDEFSRKLSWIDESNFLPHKEEYYNVKGELYKFFSAQGIKEIDGFSTITKRVMKDIKTGHSTEVVFESIKYNMGIEDTLFEERNMQNPPRRYLK
jgi:outer membrane lipoprotein-sorting protein